MKQIIAKLNTDINNPYLINNISIGLKFTLSKKNIEDDKDRYNRLKELYDEVNKISMSIRKDINIENQLAARNIGLDALEIIEEMIY